jgi:hypothetical protein
MSKDILHTYAWVRQVLPRFWELRETSYKVTAVVVDGVLIAVEPGDSAGRRFGIAFDLSTTTVVATCSTCLPAPRSR